MNAAQAKKPKVLAIVGSTATGKTALSITLAKRFSGEILSADSRQVYRGLNIGTEKITRKEMRGVPHHLLDIANPKETFSAAEFSILGGKALAEVIGRNRLPIVVGGTGFYIDALLKGSVLPEVPPNASLRRKLERKSVSDLFKLLSKKDPARAETIDRKNPRRLIRALEIIEAIGKVPKRNNRVAEYDVLWIGLRPDVKTYREVLKKRLHASIRKGLLDEIKNLKKRGITDKRINELGLEYRTGLLYLKKKVSESEMREQMLNELWSYAKRQNTWFKKNPDIIWFEPKQEKKIMQAVTRFLKHTR